MLEKVSSSQKFDPRTGRQSGEAALQVVTEGGASSIITRTPDRSASRAGLACRRIEQTRDFAAGDCYNHVFFICNESTQHCKQ